MGPLAIPGPNGVPLETPEVAAAKSAHLSALHSAGGNVAYAPPSPYYDTGASHYSASHYAPAAAVSYDGTPLETPEVAAAKAAHFAAYSEAAARNGAGHYRRKRSLAGPYYAGPQHLPVLTAGGVPADTPEVQAAKAYHSQAYAQAAHLAAVSGPGEYEGDYQGKYNGPIHVPVIGAGGVPVEPLAVQQARAAHLAALGHGSYAGAHAGYAPYSGYYGSAYPQAQIGHDGRPLDTPEVQAAKAAHFAAYSRAHAHAY